MFQRCKIIVQSQRYTGQCVSELLSNEDIPKKVWDEAQMKLASEENADEKSPSSFRMDVIWGYLSSLKLGNGSHKFGRISDVAKTVLILPHSNTDPDILGGFGKKAPLSQRLQAKLFELHKK